MIPVLFLGYFFQKLLDRQVLGTFPWTPALASPLLPIQSASCTERWDWAPLVPSLLSSQAGGWAQAQVVPTVSERWAWERPGRDDRALGLGGRLIEWGVRGGPTG